MKSLLLILTLFISLNVTAAGDINAGKKVFKKINCALCHKKDGMGKAKNGKLSIMKGPRIAGLDAKYVEEQVLAIQSKSRKTKYTSMMMAKIKKLTAIDAKNVAAYVQSLSKDKIKGMLQK